MATRSSILDLEDPMDREAWRATVPGVAKSQTRLNTHMHVCKFYFSLSLSHTHTHTHIPTRMHIQMYLFSFFSLIKPSSILKSDTN